jgi:hypothetical protein
MSESRTMGVASISRPKIGDLQRNYLFQVRLPDIVGTTRMPDPTPIESLVQDVIFGDYSFNNPSKLVVGPYSSFYASLLTVPNFQIIFLVPSPNILADYLNLWRGLIIKSDGLFGIKSDYQASMYVQLLNPQGTITGSYKLIGTWPTVQPVYNLGYAANRVATVRILFSVDKIEWTDLST